MLMLVTVTVVMLVVVILPGLMRMFVSVLVIAMGMGMTVRVTVFVAMIRLVPVVMVMIFVIGFEVDIHFDAGNAAFFLLVHMQVVALEFQLAELAAEFLGADAQINERAQEHVATDATKNIEIKRFH